jgi:Cu+-exporting ATPase
MAVVAMILAIFLTWLTLWLFFGSRSDADMSSERAARAFLASYFTDGKSTAGTVATMANSVGGTAGDAQNNREATRRLARLTLISAALTAAIIITTVLYISRGNPLPSWIASPWLRAIAATPILFSCGAPIHRVGWAALSNRIANTDSLVSLGSGVAYLYSLALCVAPSLLPEGLHEWGFASMGAAITLALLCHYIASKHSDMRIGARSATGNERRLARQERISRVVVPTVLLIAIWAFAIEIVFGPQPRLALAVIFASNVLMLAGLVMSIVWMALGRSEASEKISRH